MKTKLLGLVLLLVCGLMASCGKSDEETVKDLALKFYKDSKEGNYSSMEKYVIGNDMLFEIVKAGKEKDKQILKFMEEEAAKFEETVNGVEFSEDGTRAKVKVVLKEKKGERERTDHLDVRKIDGKWKVYRGVPGR